LHGRRDPLLVDEYYGDYTRLDDMDPANAGGGKAQAAAETEVGPVGGVWTRRIVRLQFGLDETRKMQADRHRVCIVSVLRFALVHEFAHRQQVTSIPQHTVTLYGHADQLSESGTYALILSTIEVNIALSCVSMLVMKPLLARYVPAIVSEQPLTAREDLRRWSHLTVMVHAALDEEEDVEKANRNKRRDTMISSEPMNVQAPRQVEDPGWTRGHRGSKSI